MRGGVGGVPNVLASVGPNEERIVLLRHSIAREVGRLKGVAEVVSEGVQGDVGKDIVGVTDLVWLVNVHNVDFVIPGFRSIGDDGKGPGKALP